MKVLPEAFARDEERMKRFEREAQVLASLNHPNIAAIYGIEEVDGVRALVLELVEGPTLAEADCCRSDTRRRSPTYRPADGRWAPGGAREVGDSSGPEAGKREAHARRRRQDPRLRLGHSAGRRNARRRGFELTDFVTRRDPGGCSSGHSGLHRRATEQLQKIALSPSERRVTLCDTGVPFGASGALMTRSSDGQAVWSFSSVGIPRHPRLLVPVDAENGEHAHWTARLAGSAERC